MNELPSKPPSHGEDCKFNMTQYGLRSWRFFFFCSSLSKKFSRAKIEPGTKKKIMGEGARGEDSEKKTRSPSPSPPAKYRPL